MSVNHFKGTIKIKDVNGELNSFLPLTDFSCVEDEETSLSQTLSNLEEQIEIAESSGGVELMYEEPTQENTTDYNANTLIAYLQWPDVPSDVWQYTIDTSVHIDNNGWSQPANTKSAIPFNLYGMSGITLTVDWGDGTTSTLTSSDYTEHNSVASEHTYSRIGAYTIKIKSSDWSNTYFSTLDAYSWNSSQYNNKFNFLVYFRGTLISVDSPIPAIKGIKYWKSQNTSRIVASNSLMELFLHCRNLQRIVPTLFSNCSNITSFNQCFSSCQNLLSIPEDLFKYNINATNFSECFEISYSITSIPENLFKYNTNAVNFNKCFYYCPKLEIIPENLFKYNTLADDFSECFSYCSSVTSIPENLFKYNTGAIDFSRCFSNCSSVTSIPENLFRYNTNAAFFSNCFYYNRLIASIPENLFRYNTNAVDFYSCFRSCSSLLEIPENLFKYNTLVTNFAYCFKSCSSLLEIPENLFKYNTLVTDFANCFSEAGRKIKNYTIRIGSSSVSYCENFITIYDDSGLRIIYVPSNSTTQTNFNAIASSLGLTVIGE